MKEDLKELYWVCLLLSGMFAIMFIYDWSLRAHIINGPETGIGGVMFKIFLQLRKSMLYFRAIWVVLIGLTVWMTPNFKMNKEDNEKNRPLVIGTAVILCGMFIYGFIPFAPYNYMVYPMLFFACPFFISKAINKLNTGLTDNDFLGTLSGIGKSDLSFEFLTQKGELVINNPRQGIYIEGGAGSGKSNSLCEPIIAQAVKKDFAILIYDFKGNPATLGKTAFSAMKHYDSKIKWAFINFMDPTRSHRCNPIAPKYLNSSIEIKDAVITLMTNLKREWITKPDFWSANAMLFVEGIIKRLINISRIDPSYEKYVTLPHVISMCLTSIDITIPWLRKDEDVQATMSSILTGYDQKAETQIAGIGSSVQEPMTKLFTEEVYWVLSANEVDLDINRHDNVTMLSLANDPSLKEALSPAISLIIKVVLKQINQQGKHPRTLIMIDELPTIYIPKLDETPATGRSNGLVTCAALQDYAQLSRDYGQIQAETIIGNLGNQFFGMSNNLKTGQRVSDMIGEGKRKDTSYSESDSGQSQSHSMKREKILQANEILGQKIGHFTGKIAGGEPPFFSTQFPRYEDMKIKPVNIPEFAKIFNVPSSPEKEKLMMKEAMIANKRKIHNEVQELLNDYSI